MADYLEMLEKELRGEAYSKTEHRERLKRVLDGRSDGSIEYKHQNISAVLIELGQPYIDGYKPQVNYQALLFDVVEDRLRQAPELLRTVEQKVESEASVPTVEDILAALVSPPAVPDVWKGRQGREGPPHTDKVPNYLLREARNVSLGTAGEVFVLNFERARLIRDGKESLAADVEHVSATQGDHLGFDVLSFEADGAERLIEVKTTAFGQMTPFFVSKNQMSVSEREVDRFHLYRLFRFRNDPKLFTRSGPIRAHFNTEPSEYLARPA